MTQLTPFTGADGNPKKFIQRPEGKAGLIVGAGILVGAGYLLYQALPYLIELAKNALYLSGMLIALGALLYMVFDPKMRNLIWYMYKSIMRTVTGWFVQIDPIGILKSYIEDLENNLKKNGHSDWQHQRSDEKASNHHGRKQSVHRYEPQISK